MYQPLRIQQLANKLAYLEQQVNVIRIELGELQEQARALLETASPDRVAVSWTDKAAQRQQLNSLFTALSIQGVAEGTDILQQRMAHAGLEHNELSRGLVEAREE
jgi:hypothetical protein